ncbi:MAG TPA: hypothetical protein VE338_02130 [Ktedonobacterales bacterium]|nr:hypothetical protein [Ktedonobacterales bacterium]
MTTSTAATRITAMTAALASPSPITTTTPPPTTPITPRRKRTADDANTQLRRAGQRLLRALRATSDDLNAAIVAAAYEAPRAPVRIASVTTLAETMRAASALLTLPPVLAGEASGIVTGLACADCYGDPARSEIVVGAEALDALDDAEVALDDALVIAGLERTGKRRSRNRMYTAADEANALQALRAAMATAERVRARARRLADDLDRLPQLLRIAQGVRPHTATA